MARDHGREVAPAGRLGERRRGTCASRPRATPAPPRRTAPRRRTRSPARRGRCPRRRSRRPRRSHRAARAGPAGRPCCRSRTSRSAPGRRRCARARAGAGLVGIGGRAALQDRVPARRRRSSAVEPAGSGPAVVVGERDQRRVGRPPAEVALGGRPGDARPGRGSARPGPRAGARMAGRGRRRRGRRSPRSARDRAGRRATRARRRASSPWRGWGSPPLSRAASCPQRSQFTARHSARENDDRGRRRHARSPRTARAAAAGAGRAGAARRRGRRGRRRLPASTDAVLAAERARGALPLRTIARPGTGRPRDRARRGLARQRGGADRVHRRRLRADAGLARRHGGAPPLANPGCFVQGRTLPNPAELGDLGPFSRTISVRRARPGVPDLQHGLPAGAARARRRLRHARPSAASRAARIATSPGARSRPGRGPPSAPRRSSTTPSTTSGRSASCASRRAGRRR